MIKSSGSLWVLAAFFLLQACAVAPQTQSLIADNSNVIPRHQIQSVPFYPQQEYFCGPTALSEVLNYYGHNYDPEQLAQQVFVPDKQGSLQIEMVALTRQLGFIPYAGKASLLQVLNWVSEDIPVIVLQNLGLDSLPYWHYAVVIGYDLKKETISLHTGITQNRQVPMDVFENTWRRSHYWTMVPLPKNKIGTGMDDIVYTQAALDVLNTGNVELGVSGLMFAHNQWPSNWLAGFALGNHYFKHDINTSVNWYQAAHRRAKNELSILNNYMYALEKKGCYPQAEAVLACMQKQDDEQGVYSDSINEMTIRLKNKPNIANMQCAKITCAE